MYLIIRVAVDVNATSKPYIHSATNYDTINFKMINCAILNVMSIYSAIAAIVAIEGLRGFKRFRISRLRQARLFHGYPGFDCRAFWKANGRQAVLGPSWKWWPFRGLRERFLHLALRRCAGGGCILPAVRWRPIALWVFNRWQIVFTCFCFYLYPSQNIPDSNDRIYRRTLSGQAHFLLILFYQLFLPAKLINGSLAQESSSC